MNSCLEVAKLLIMRKLAPSELERLAVEAEIKTHNSNCASCAKLSADLTASPVAMSSVRSAMEGGHRYHGRGQVGDGEETRMTTELTREAEAGGKFYTLFVDGQELRSDEPVLTVAQIKLLAGVPIDVPLIEVRDDGIQIQLSDDEAIELKPGRRFKKAPRFVRG